MGADAGAGDELIYQRKTAKGGEEGEGIQRVRWRGGQEQGIGKSFYKHLTCISGLCFCNSPGSLLLVIILDHGETSFFSTVCKSVVSYSL